VDDLDDCQTRIRIEFDPPELFKMRTDRIVLHALIVRKDHRYEPGVGCALDVVLAAQGMKARPWASHLAAHQGKRDEAARIIRAMHVLRNAHAPEDHRAACRAKGPRDLADGGGVDPANPRHLFWREILHMVFDDFEVFGMSLNILLVV